MAFKATLDAAADSWRTSAPKRTGGGADGRTGERGGPAGRGDGSQWGGEPGGRPDTAPGGLPVHCRGRPCRSAWRTRGWGQLRAVQGRSGGGRS